MQWKPISGLYNWVQKDPVLDWLDTYGEANGFKPDTALDSYLEAADYGHFVRNVAQAFETRVLELIGQRLDVVVVGGARSNQDDFYRQTLRLMSEGREAIYQGLVRDPDLELFGVPDLIVKGSALNLLVPNTIGDLDPSDYYVADIKFKGLELNKRGDLRKGPHAWERVQLALYERALATMRGRAPARAFVIGRRLAGEAGDGGGCFDVLPWVGPLDDDGLALVGDGIAWLSDLREHGATWTLEPPSDSRLIPNAKNSQDSPWHDVKRRLPSPVEREPWQGPPVQPSLILAGREEWYEPRGVEFFVDFETLNAMNDDFSRLPAAGGRPMIFMIGCGHEEGGEWRFKVWTCEAETYEEERRIVEAWLDHMRATAERLSPGNGPTHAYHWHSHEVTETAKAAARHRAPEWLTVPWYDLLANVFRAEPVEIIDIASRSLKPVAKKLHEKGLIQTVWGEGAVAGGLEAMTAAWSCYAAARETGERVHEAVRVGDKSLMGEIETYNEVDCRTMWEILRYLRAHH